MNGGESVPEGGFRMGVGTDYWNSIVCIGWKDWCKEKDIPTDAITLMKNRVNAILEIDLSDQSLTDIPSLNFLSELEKLNLSGNKLKSFSQDFEGTMRIRVLDLRENQLIELPESIGELENLTHLYIKGNPLKTIPENLKNKEGLIIDVEI